PKSIAQELDLDFGGSGGTIFDPETMAAARKGCRRPDHECEMLYDHYHLDPSLEFKANGNLKLWINPTPGERNCPSGIYGIGADIASGLGGSTHSNSVACVLDLVTGEQVAEWASNSTRPDDFCDVCIALAKWFHNATIIHEANGPFGKTFTGQLIRRGYGNVYRRKERFKWSAKTSKDIGWGSNQETKPEMFSELSRKVRYNIVKVRSKLAVDEFRSWVMENGRIVHDKAMTTEDQSSKNEAHGDRVIALGVAAILYSPDINSQISMPDLDSLEISNPASNTMAYRIEQYDRAMREAEALDW
ncbi:MAG: hypothetical protein ACYTFQ_32320, partial [Planctomycetota bacterium]